MKKLMISMLAMASMTAMVSCSNENDPIDDAQDQPVEIKINAGVYASTKTPVVSDNDGHLSGALSNVQFVKAEDIADNPIWTDISDIASIGSIAETNGGISFNTKLYYNADASLKSWLIGYYPECENANNKPSAGSLEWTIDGKKDILISNMVNGCKTTGSQMSTIAFKHQLTQLKFLFVTGDDGAKDAWGNITNIKIKTGTTAATAAINNKATYTLSNTTASQAGDITWGTSSTDISVYGASQSGDVITYTDTPLSSIVLSATETLGGYAIVPPLNAMNSYILIITTENKANIPVQINLSEVPAAGKSHKVVLTFKSTEITPTATIAQWDEVSTPGTGTIE